MPTGWISSRSIVRSGSARRPTGARSGCPARTSSSTRIAVARTLVEQQLDTTSIVAALLHDVVEDSDIRTEDIAREFGAEVAGIVDGLTKIASLTFRSAGRAAGRELPEAAALDRQGRPGHHHQAGRPAAQHADARPAGAGEAAAHRDRDPRDLRPAGAPLRHGRDQGGAGRPDLQVPGAGGLQGPGAAGRGQAGRAGAGDPQAQGPAGAGTQAGGDLLVRCHRPAQASLVDLPEDEEAQQAVRRDLRPDGRAGDR